MMGDFTSLNQRLHNLSLETTALAVILIRRKQLLTYASKLPISALQELVELINSYSKISAENLKKQISPSRQKTGNGDMVRFIQLQSTQGNYLFYAVSLTREMLLALVFDQDTPFSNVRRQTKYIARELLAPEQATSLEYRPSYPENVRQHPPLTAEPGPPGTSGEFTAGQLTPAVSEFQPGSIPSAEGSTTAPEFVPAEPGGQETKAESPTSGEVGTLGYHDNAELEDQSVGEPLTITGLGEGDISQTGSSSDSNTASPPSSFGHYITYSCLLIPRMPQHLMTSNLVSYLFKWMGQLCLAYGWRLEHLSIHSDYIQWIAGAPLATSPAFLVRILRQKTSQYIFTQFPPLTNENPSGDFWAPGFFISGGKQTIQPHLIDKYINEIREQQGVYHSTSYQ